MLPRNGWSHVIIGAGAAGCLLAARLSENQKNRVLLVEAGGQGRDPRLMVPIMTGMLLRGQHHTWQFMTEPIPGLNGRKSAWPCGRVLGGSTAINGMVYARGLPLDYDRWAQQGLSSWSWEQVRPYFIKSENFLGPESPDHGQKGELGVSTRERRVSPLADVFVAAGLSLGFPEKNDSNSPGAFGFGYHQFTIRNGRRESSATAFLRPVARRKNLVVLTDATVNKIHFTGTSVYQIEVATKNGIQFFSADKETILSAGAIGSPKLLMLSGIGAATDLQAVGVKPVTNLPEVGRNLQDHVLIRVRHEATGGTLHHLTRIDRAVVAFLRALIFGSGPATVFPLEATASVNVVRGDNIPDIQCNFLPALSSATVRVNPFRHDTDNIAGFMANACLMRPESRGYLALRDSSPSSAPLIQPNYLDVPRDLRMLIKATRFLRKIFSQPAFDPWRGQELSPGQKVESDEDIAEWVRDTADTVYHPSGTCRMGVDDNAVVDSELRVRGIRGLRVVDASIFPTITSENTAAPTMMVAEKAATLINECYTDKKGGA